MSILIILSIIIIVIGFLVYNIGLWLYWKGTITSGVVDTVLVIGIIVILIAIVLLCFSKQLPPPEKIQ